MVPASVPRPWHGDLGTRLDSSLDLGTDGQRGVFGMPSPGLPADERLREVAGIFAAGILRLRMQAALLASDPAPENPPKARQPDLSVPASTA
jgi:hypothetical protein